MSEIKVNTISERTSANGVTIDGVNIKDSKLVTADSVVTTNITDLNITSGKIADDAITLAKMAPGTDGNIISYDASGNPVAVATGSAGQILTSAGAGAPPTFATAAAAGITNAQQWRISANQTNMDNGDHITNNWEQADTYGYGGIGTAMSQSSGIFTFPTTGIWLITHNVTFQDATEQNHMSCIITATTDNSSYNSVSISMTHLKLINSSTTNTHASAQHIFDVTNTTTHKIRFATGAENNGYDVNGTTAANYTSATFIRLGDT
jgi:hypothetical protein